MAVSACLNENSISSTGDTCSLIRVPCAYSNPQVPNSQNVRIFTSKQQHCMGKIQSNMNENKPTLFQVCVSLIDS